MHIPCTTGHELWWPARVYVISGHYDSRVTDVLNATSDAPGADDDASGVAVSLELARVLLASAPGTPKNVRVRTTALTRGGHRSPVAFPTPTA